MNNSFSLREYKSVIENCYKYWNPKEKGFWKNSEELDEIFYCHETNCKPIERYDFYKFSKSLLQKLPKEIDIPGWFLGVSFSPLPDFDALLFTDKFFVDLELKDRIGNQKLSDIRNQFKNQNRVFKRIDNQKQILNLVFVANENRLYRYISETDNYAKDYNFEKLANCLKDSKSIEKNLISSLSRSDFLISPLDNLDKFIKNEYFLDTPQANIKKEILKDISNKFGQVFAIEGEAGTGKSLIAYDLVKTLAPKKILFIYPGDLKDKQKEFGQFFNNIAFCAGKDLTEDILDQYLFIMIDEAQRLYHEGTHNTLGVLTKWIESNYKDHVVIFFFDSQQAISPKDCGQLLHNLCQTYEKDKKGKLLKLTAAKRSNSSIFYFVRNLFNLNKKAPNWVTTLNYKENIEIKYFPDSTSSLNWIESKINEGYKFLLPTKDKFSNSSVDEFDSLEEYSKNTHHAIGEENSKIITIIDNSLEYSHSGQLQSSVSTSKNYYYYMDNEVYVNMTRAKDKLALAIINNFDVYLAIVEKIFTEKKKK